MSFADPITIMTAAVLAFHAGGRNKCCAALICADQESNRFLSRVTESRHASKFEFGLSGRDDCRLRGIVVLCVDPLHEASEGRGVNVRPVDTAFLGLFQTASEENVERTGDFRKDGGVNSELFLVRTNDEGEDPGFQDTDRRRGQLVSLRG